MAVAQMKSAPMTGAQLSAEQRAEFIRKTYHHLAGAILVFAVLEYFLINSPIAAPLAQMMTGGYSWLIVLGLFMGVSYIADKWARSSSSLHMQYAGLALYVFAESIIFVPLLLFVSMIAPGILLQAAILTGMLFVGLTIVAFTTRKDFSFLGGILAIGGIVALGVIAASIIFGFSLGLLFSVIMIAFASGAILYNTSNIIHHYSPTQYVAASLSLFASVALLFWYIVQLLMALSSD